MRASKDEFGQFIDTRCGVSNYSYGVQIEPGCENIWIILSREIPDNNSLLKAFVWLMWADWSPMRRDCNQGLSWEPAPGWEELAKVRGDIVSILIAYLQQVKLPTIVCFGW